MRRCLLEPLFFCWVREMDGDRIRRVGALSDGPTRQTMYGFDYADWHHQIWDDLILNAGDL